MISEVKQILSARAKIKIQVWLPGSVSSLACNIASIFCTLPWGMAWNNIWAAWGITYKVGLDPHSGEEYTELEKVQSLLFPCPCKGCPSEHNLMMASLVIWDKNKGEGFIYSEFLWFKILSPVSLGLSCIYHRSKCLSSAPLTSPMPPHPTLGPRFVNPLSFIPPQNLCLSSLLGNTEHILGQRVMSMPIKPPNASSYWELPSSWPHLPATDTANPRLCWLLSRHQAFYQFLSGTGVSNRILWRGFGSHLRGWERVRTVLSEWGHKSPLSQQCHLICST